MGLPRWLAILVLVYLGCGVAYAASQGVREPAKMLPNREFWAGLPAMVSAGVTFFLAAVQGKSTRPVVASGGVGAAPGVRPQSNSATPCIPLT